jgi:hypothetical protein
MMLRVTRTLNLRRRGGLRQRQTNQATESKITYERLRRRGERLRRRGLRLRLLGERERRRGLRLRQVSALRERATVRAQPATSLVALLRITVRARLFLQRAQTVHSDTRLPGERRHAQTNS